MKRPISCGCHNSGVFAINEGRVGLIGRLSFCQLVILEPNYIEVYFCLLVRDFA